MDDLFQSIDHRETERGGEREREREGKRGEERNSNRETEGEGMVLIAQSMREERPKREECYKRKRMKQRDRGEKKTWGKTLGADSVHANTLRTPPTTPPLLSGVWNLLLSNPVLPGWAAHIPTSTSIHPRSSLIPCSHTRCTAPCVYSCQTQAQFRAQNTPPHFPWPGLTPTPKHGARQ